MFLKRYHITENGYVHLWFSQNRQVCIRLDHLSGKIITRNKVGGNIQHTGIWLGTDYTTGQVYVIHNHPFPGYAHITTKEDYAQGEQISLKQTVCINAPLEVIRIGLNRVIERRKYKLLSDNCQTLVNSACNNKSYSEDAVKWGGLALSCFVIYKALKKAS